MLDRWLAIRNPPPTSARTRTHTHTHTRCDCEADVATFGGEGVTEDAFRSRNLTSQSYSMTANRASTMEARVSGSDRSEATDRATSILGPTQLAFASAAAFVPMVLMS